MTSATSATAAKRVRHVAATTGGAAKRKGGRPNDKIRRAAPIDAPGSCELSGSTPTPDGSSRGPAAAAVHVVRRLTGRGICAPSSRIEITRPRLLSPPPSPRFASASAAAGRTPAAQGYTIGVAALALRVVVLRRAASGQETSAWPGWTKRHDSPRSRGCWTNGLGRTRRLVGWVGGCRVVIVRWW